MPRLVLICCESEIAKSYFDTLHTRILNIPCLIATNVDCKARQHKELIDNIVDLRSTFAKREKIAENEIECWVVCEDKDPTLSFEELCSYSQKQCVNISFSVPHFKAYLLQHFENDKENLRSPYINPAFRKIDNMSAEEISNIFKPDLIESFLTNVPKTVKIAVDNSKRYNDPSSSPFFTVHKLVNRLIDLKQD